jgi:putative transposase
MMMQLIDQHAPRIGVAPLCDALNVARASYYRWKYPVYGARRPCPSPRALSTQERQEVLDLLHSPRFVDRAPAEVVATLLDDGTYRCSERTMYRILDASSEVRERRDQLRKPTYTKPELLATRPNELWSWDITKLHGPAKWTYFYLYVILDVFSRYVVGWMVATQETAALAEELIRTTCERQRIPREQLTIHADRGTSMTSKPVALLLSDLGVTKTHSRPHVSNDNPFSEAHFKTLKYRPGFPERFGTIEDSRAHCASFFDWYNNDHRHSGIAMLTPHDLHHGLADKRTAQRAAVLAAAHRAHPERFVRGAPAPKSPPREVWINPPQRSSPASETPLALGGAEAGGGAEVQGCGGAAPDLSTEEVLH